MKSKLWQLAFLLFTAIGFSQSVTVSGKVFDSSTNSPLNGATVSVKNAGLATTTSDGSFTVSNIKVGTTLTISFYGYFSKDFEVTKEETVSISLTQDNKAIEEVVVIGYGTQKKKDVTGAVGYVGSKTIEQLKPIKIEQALQGTVAGVTVTSGSGAPGSGFSVLIRGIQSNGDNAPLYIVDGNISDPSILNPSDIESFTVLKDAQAAIYGVRGANGVVIIKTKTGKKNTKTTFSYNSYLGQQETTKKLNLLNATEYALLLNESYANGGQALPYPNVSNLGRGTDWQNEVFSDNASIISHDINVSGGSDKITYAVSGSHLEQEGIVGLGKSDFRRNTAAISLGVDLTKKLKFQTNLNYTFLTRRSLSENGLGSVLFNAINTPSTISPFASNGDYSLIPSTPGFGIEVINPLAQINNTYNDYNIKRLSGAFGLDYSILPDLVLSSKVGFNTANSEGKSFSKIVNYGGKVFDVQRSSVSQDGQNFNNYVFDLYLNYKKAFNNHTFTGTIGTSNTKDWGNGLFATGFDVPNNSWDFADISLANGLPTSKNVGSYVYDDRLNSYFARLQYDYDGKYLLSGLARRDSSTRFGPDNSVAYFYSATAGWVVSKESFLSNVESINLMKFRASYGTLGNDKIPSNGYVGFLNGEATYVFDNALVNGVTIGQLANPGLQWETARKFDVGLDLKLFKNQLDITTDYFIETRSNLLIPGLPVTGIVGAAAPGGGAPTVNAGSTENKGFEFSIGYNKKINDNLSFSVNSNLTTIDNVVTEVSDSRGIIEGGNFGVGQPLIARMERGQSIGYFYGLQADGIFQNQAEVDAHPSQAALGAASAPGDIRFKDVNGDGIINLNDRTKIGSPLPEFTLGFNTNIKYKNVDFAAYSYASIGNDMVRNYERTLSDLNKLDYVLDRWTGEGTSNTVPRVTTGATNNNLFSSYFVEDASFFRIQNIQLGYSLGEKVIKNFGITRLRFYAAVNNVYTFTKYRGFDPAATNGAPIGGGIDYGFYPTPRIYMFGLNLNF
ncbi:SusC/RagA family TonB-linked outer membrane protein [Flavobacterium difficile]|uniref:TonB-dependent receptor n=1 Tax=Flavobacterium difficile TaxID=2709659 RepID=A0ABX0I1Z7_9FLAO|nr:TonB-dependent receptor [Flavobacterium difficile]NHM01206.1 TonB-dependent receptor [Flavobacterium difficile]